MINKQNIECCGCTACKSACPKNAISMKENAQGFVYPIVDDSKCVQCGICEKVCEFNKKSIDNIDTPIVFAAKRKKDRKYSQSGGVFSALAEKVLINKGVVYGVISDKHEIHYCRVNEIEGVKALRGSKYAQANIDGTYERVEKDLIKSVEVLFSGTPCYVAGLKSFLISRKVSTDKLITCDLICHGVPSPKILREYIRLLQERYGKILEFNHRDKCNGWHGHITSFRTNKKKYVSNNYVEIFYSNLELRESCYVCPYANEHRVADITLGDFWGIEKVKPEFDDNKGCSLIIVNTEKGKKKWDEVKGEFELFESNLQDCKQTNMERPTNKPKEYDLFWECYHSKGLVEAASVYCKFDWKNDKNRYRFLFRKLLGRILHMIMK